MSGQFHSTGGSDNPAFGRAGEPVDVDRSYWSDLQKKLEAEFAKPPHAVKIFGTSSFRDLTIAPAAETRLSEIEVLSLKYTPDRGIYLFSDAETGPYSVSVLINGGTVWHRGLPNLSEDQLSGGTVIKITFSRGSTASASTSEIFLAVPHFDGTSVVTRSAGPGDLTAALTKSVAERQPVVLGIAPSPAAESAAGLTCALGGPGTAPSHALIELREDGRYRLKDLGSRRGFWVQRLGFPAIDEYFPKRAETSVTPGDRVWFGVAPFVGLRPSVVIPAVPGGPQSSSAVALSDLSKRLSTTESMTAFVLAARLNESSIGITPEGLSDHRITLRRPEVHDRATIRSTSGGSGDFELVRVPKSGMMEPSYGRPLAITNPFHPPRSLSDTLGVVPLNPGDCVVAGREIDPSSHLWFSVPFTEAYARHQNQLALERDNKAREAERKAANATALVHAAFDALVKGETPSVVFHRESAKPERGGVRLPLVFLSERRPLVVTAHEGGTFLLSGAQLLTVSVAHKAVGDTFSTPVDVGPNNPIRVAPGDKIIFNTHKKGEIQILPITVPNNSKFTPPSNGDNLARVVASKQVSKNSGLQSLTSASLSLGSVLQAGDEKVDISYLRYHGLEPSNKFSAYGAKFSISQPFFLDTHRRLGFVAIVEHEGTKALRIFYTSGSHAPLFRLLPAVNDGVSIWLPGYDKAGDENSLAPPWEVQKMLAAAVTKAARGSGILDLSDSEHVWQRAVLVNKSLDGYFKYAEDKESNPAILFTKVPFFAESTTPGSPIPFQGMQLSEDLRANFRGNAIDSFEFLDVGSAGNRAYGGSISCYRYLSVDGTMEYTLAKAPDCAHIAQISPVAGKMTTFGLRDHYVDGGIWTLPGRERADAVPIEFHHRYLKYHESGYWNTVRILANNPILQAWGRDTDEGRAARSG